MKVGVVVPSFNQGKYIERTLKSIIENKKHILIDLVVIDGGSSDDTVSIIKKYEHEILYWQSQKDQGQSDAINKGMEYTIDCDYVMWLNSDDEYESEYSVVNIVQYAESKNAAVCYGKSYLIDEKGKKIAQYPTERFDKDRLRYHCYISQPSVLIKRDVWYEVSGVNPNLQMCMDYELWIKLSMKYNFEYIESPIGNTRIYGETKTSLNQKRHLDEAICIIDKYYGSVPLHWLVSKKMKEGKMKNSFLIRAICNVYVGINKNKFINDAKSKVY